VLTNFCLSDQGRVSGHCPFHERRVGVKVINMPERGENQVLIKIRASEMCYTDAHQNATLLKLLKIKSRTKTELLRLKSGAQEGVPLGGSGGSIGRRKSHKN
jgi:hypothetical protein